MRYWKSRAELLTKQKAEDFLYRVYVTDALKSFTDAKVRWFDLVDDIEHPKPVETRSAEEIITSIKDRINNG